MELKSELRLQLLAPDELAARTARITEAMRAADTDGIVVSDNAGIYYLTGRVFCGYIYLHSDGRLRYYLRRPNHLQGDSVMQIRKPEDMTADIMATFAPAAVGLEEDSLPCSMASRLRASLPAGASASPMLRAARAVKTATEIELMRRSGIAQAEVYSRIPHLYADGMSDIELQIEIERALRLHGCLGIFRIAGQSMELHMGNVLTGANADTPSPYDFAMGGAGLDPSIPVGADGTIIRPGLPVMVDMNGNFTGYMTDMTRCYCLGEPQPEAVKLNELSRSICAAVAEAAVPGAAARDLYELAAGMAREAGYAEAFMGHRYHAGFVGHGIGIEVNELPVLAPRSRDILAEGMTYACEPKFVVPGLGAVGIENTYVVRASGPAECITPAPEQIISLR
ncbi:MAG: M24 family metallopeptidase [Bacteroides sp.]|nr:M24 family metallopeptidase [Bacteroides sp.]